MELPYMDITMTIGGNGRMTTSKMILSKVNNGWQVQALTQH